jgi:hypothetical protein
MKQRPIGEDHGHAKLTNEQARRVIEMLAEGRLTSGKVASLFGVSAATVSLINSGRSWRHIPRPDKFRQPSQVVAIEVRQIATPV